MIPEYFGCGQTTIASASSTKIAPSDAKIVSGLQMMALSDNADIIYVGHSDVTALNGFPLAPGAGLFIPVGAVDLIYGLAVSNGDKIAWLRV